MPTIAHPVARSLALTISVSFSLLSGAAANADDCQFVRDAIERLSNKGGSVEIPAGTFNCESPIIIAKDDVTLKGAGRDLTIFRLADQVHAPLLVIGHPQTIVVDHRLVTPIRVNRVRVEGMSFDGNGANHDPKKECGETHCDGDATSIRNNAITIRGASYVTIKDVSAHSSNSGGLVTEKYCDHLRIENFSSYKNFFDGIAGYETEESDFINVHLHDNRAAGISLDLQFNNNRFLDSRIMNNGDVGIFARELHGNVFERVRIIGSGNHGAFLSTPTDSVRECANGNTFRDVIVSGSKGRGLFVSKHCTGNVVEGVSTLQNNRGCTDGNWKIGANVRCDGQKLAR